MIKAIKEIFTEHISYRKQIMSLAKSDLIKTYRGAALGWSWAVIKPTVTIFAYWFAFSVGLRSGKDVGEYPFFLWLICGMIPWFYIHDMLTSGTDSYKRYKYLVTKLKYPVSTIPTFVSLSKMIVSIVMIAICIIIFALLGFYPDIYYLQIPILIIMTFVFFTVFTQLSALIAAVSSDYGNLVKSFVTAIFWFSGILWDADKITVPWLKTLLFINPITYLITGYRDAFINKKWFFLDAERLVFFILLTLIAFSLFVFLYKRLKKEIPDVL